VKELTLSGGLGDEGIEMRKKRSKKRAQTVLTYQKRSRMRNPIPRPPLMRGRALKLSRASNTCLFGGGPSARGHPELDPRPASTWPASRWSSTCDRKSRRIEAEWGNSGIIRGNFSGSGGQFEAVAGSAVSSKIVKIEKAQD
jgi:hypothetical protein